MYTRHEISEAEHRNWFARNQIDQSSLWFIHESTTGQPDGVVGFSDYQPKLRRAFWGFYASPDAQAGTGTRLGLDALDKAFTELKLHKLNGEVIVTNEASARLQAKLGFKVEGRFRDHHFDGEKHVDVIRLGILAAEWASVRPEIVAGIGQLEAMSQCDRTSLRRSER